MTYPKNELAQLVLAYCAAYQIEDVVISPGSRNAPLTIGFTSHPDIKTYSITDERCAAFFALGMAQQKRKPVAVVCTSGTAVLNYYPAVAEAFYSDIPLVVISADRPKHLIDIGDGQTIRQEHVLDKHCLFSTNLDAAKDQLKENSTKLKKALETTVIGQGPVHINVPFDEPLYERVDRLYFDILPYNIPEVSTPDLINELLQKWNQSKQKMILVGTHDPDPELQKVISSIAQDPSVIVLTETTSNLHGTNFINSIDKLIMPISDKEFEGLKPDLLLTFGGMIISKKIKKLLRTYPPGVHWHVDQKKAMDTYFALSEHLQIAPINFFIQLDKGAKRTNSSYQKQWLELKELRAKAHTDFMSQCSYSDLTVFETILSSLPDEIQLQLGNSSVVRYAQLFDLNPRLQVYCNRGTSGIDGSTSTAIGAAFVHSEQTVFITGDLSFFYDSNALWNAYIPKNFRILLINNAGGGIFRFIEGPQSTDSLEYFETPHSLRAEKLCELYHISYSRANTHKELTEILAEFYTEGDQPKLLEVVTPREENDQVLKAYFKALK